MSLSGKRNIGKMGTACLAGIAVIMMTACGGKGESDNNLIVVESKDEKTVNLFSPMEKTEADVENTARSAADKTVILAEEKLGVKVEYVTYTAEDYQDKTYDDVTLDRARNDMDDIYLALPETPEEFLECCRVFQENGIETPVGANRWWLETFVLAQAYADLYNGGNTEAEIAALNSGESKYSDYMRPGFEFLKELIDKGYVDAEKALVSEAIEGEGEDFLAQKTPIVMAYWGAANTDTAYGNPDFEMQVIGFPTKRGQMPVMPMTGFGVGINAEHGEDAMEVLDVMLSDEALQIYAETNRVISPSKNVEVECIPALKPLNDKIQDNVYVLGSNAGMNVEQWGNTCLIVRDLLGGATVDECMAKFDKLQEEALNK
ncbi:MAG: extracellular solute-binding protein [Lachnospiraceae bacterium]|nr:extracellular solute-binding protein [Lachnospiraceae bacterium]